MPAPRTMEVYDKEAIDLIKADIDDIQTDVSTKHGEVSDDATAVSTMLGMAQDIQTDVTNKQTDVATKHEEVSDDATAVSTMLGMVQDIQTDVTNKQSDVATKHEEVSDDATAVSTMLGMAQAIQTDLTEKQTDVTTKHGEVSDDATAVSTMLGMAQAIQTDLTEKQTDVTTKHGEVSDDATAVSTMLGMVQAIQTDLTDKQTDVTTKHGEVSDDATAVSTMLGMVQALYDTIQDWFNTISGWYTQMEAWVSQVSTNTTNAANSATQAGASAASAANLVLGVSTNRPSIRPSLLLDFANSELLDPRVTYTRNDSAKTYFDRNGVLRTAKPNQWPREFDPVSKKCLGRSVWESRVNLFTSSSDFSTSWSLGGASVETSGVKAPDGSNAQLLRETSSTGTHGPRKLLTMAPSTVYTFSVFARKKEITKFQLTLAADGASFCVATFDLATATITNGVGIVLSQIRDVGGGWYRCSIVSTSPATLTSSYQDVRFVQTGTGSNSYTGNGSDGLYLFGAQFEAGAIASPYIPTGASAVTRQADIAYIDGLNFQDLWNNEESTVYTEGNGFGSSTTGQVMATVQQDSSNYAYFGYRTNVQNTRALTLQTTAGGFVILNGNIPYGDMRIAGVVKKGAYRSIVNGGSVQSNTYDYAIAPVILQIGRLLNWYYHNGTIACICIWPKALPDVEIQAMVTSGLLSGKSANQLPTAGDLGSAAFESLPSLLMRPNRQEFPVEGTGSSRTITIRRPYDFTFTLVDATGSTVTAQPSATCAANTNYSLTFNAPAGTLLTYAITPIF